MSISVAVVIPNLNGADTLRRCLASVDIQTVRPQEVIVVDGLSSDRSPFILRNWMHEAERFQRLWINAPARGMANARNIGIRAATADVIVPLDSDDWLEPTYIEECAAILDEDECIGVVAPSIIWPDGHVQDCKDEITREHLLAENCLFAGSMFQREAWAEVGGYTEYRRTYEDWEFWLSIVDRGWTIAPLRKGLYHYCPHDRGSTGRMKPGDHEEYVRHVRERFGTVKA